MDKTDFKMKLFLADSINVEGISITPLTLGEISRMGYSQYSQLLSLLNFKVESPEKNDALLIFDIAMADEEETIRTELVNAIKVFLKVDKIIVNPKYGAMFLNEMPTDLESAKLIKRDTYKEILRVINLQNCITSLDEFEQEKKPPKNKMAQYIRNKFKQGREIVNKVKGQDSDSTTDFVDIMSAVSAKSNSINKLNIMNLTIYQLHDEFNRLRMIDQFDISIQAIMNGAKDAEIVHWSEKISKD